MQRLTRKLVQKVKILDFRQETRTKEGTVIYQLYEHRHSRSL